MVLPEAGDVDVAGLAALYGWPRPRWVRACLVMSLDGGLAGPDGLSGTISSPADRAVLAATRATADAYLVGAATVRAEGYSPVHAKPAHEAERASRGQAPAATLAVVSGSCDFDWSAARFQHSDNPPIVLTTEAANPAARARAAEQRCEVVIAGERTVDLVAALDALAERGLTRVTAEGGRTLIAQLVAGDLIDEVDLTVSPTLVAGHRPEAVGPGVLHRMRLAQLLEDDGFLFTRHLRAEER